MRDYTEATGFVLRAEPQGEFDKRLVLLTAEYGKITAFVRGARRPTSPMLAACNPFVLARFYMYEGKSAYTMAKVSVEDYFTEIGALDPGVYYGFYFLELCSFYCQENLEAGDTVNLLYVTLKALLRGSVPESFIRRVFECRLMHQNGDFAVPEDGISKSAALAFDRTINSPLTSLYTFELKGKALSEYSGKVSERLYAITGNKLKSLNILTSIDEGGRGGYNQNSEGFNEDI